MEKESTNRDNREDIEELSHDIKLTNRTGLLIAVILILILSISLLGYYFNWWQL